MFAFYRQDAMATQTHRKPHIPYTSLITEAISRTKGRSHGSSAQAIRNYIAEQHGDDLPHNFATYLRSNLAKMTDNGEILKVRET